MTAPMVGNAVQRRFRADESVPQQHQRVRPDEVVRRMQAARMETGAAFGPEPGLGRVTWREEPILPAGIV